MSKVYEYVTDRILKALDDGIVPWRKPWNSGSGLARNGVTGWVYRGVNVWMTAAAGYSSPFWFSKKDIGKQKGKIRKGEKATIIVYFRFLESKTETNSDGSAKKFPMLRYYNVWNLEQLDGVEPSKKAIGERDKDAARFEAIQDADALLAASPVRPGLGHGGSRAYYTPATDRIQMPNKDDFVSAENYYATLFHEYGHATGHESRLNRDLSGIFGDHSYSKEELIAEMTSAFLCGIVGIDTDQVFDNSIAYLNSWRSKISKDKRLVVQAASAAQKATDKILGTEFKDKDSDATESK